VLQQLPGKQPLPRLRIWAGRNANRQLSPLPEPLEFHKFLTQGLQFSLIGDSATVAGKVGRWAREAISISRIRAGIGEAVSQLMLMLNLRFFPIFRQRLAAHPLLNLGAEMWRPTVWLVDRSPLHRCSVTYCFA